MDNFGKVCDVIDFAFLRFIPLNIGRPGAATLWRQNNIATAIPFTSSPTSLSPILRLHSTCKIDTTTETLIYNTFRYYQFYYTVNVGWREMHIYD